MYNLISGYIDFIESFINRNLGLILLFFRQGFNIVENLLEYIKGLVS
jgi:hypothetical protein